MALQINAALTTKDGGTVASGSHVKFEAYFPQEGFKYSASLQVWRTEQAHTDGLQPLRGIVEIPQLSFEKELTELEYAALTPIVVHDDIKAYLEQYVGADNVAVIL